MSSATVVLITLIIYKIVLVSIGLLARDRNHNETDFFLGGRGLGPWVGALSASASSSSAWTLLGVSGFAFSQGLSALWLFPACVGGFLLNWFLIAPRLQPYSKATNALTVTDILAGDQSSATGKAIATLASAIILFSLLFYVASQFQGSAKTFQSTFGLSLNSSILIGAAIIVFYTMVGGFWAVSLTDALQGSVMAATAVIMPLGVLWSAGGPVEFWQALGAVDAANFQSLTRGLPLAAGLGFIAGLLGIGLGYPGQPHVVNRFMAMRDNAALRQGRVIAIGWAVVVYSGMIVVGLGGRVLFGKLTDSETVFFAVANQLFHPVLAGVMIAAVLSATMSTADSQLLVAASSITHDLPFKWRGNMLRTSRVVVLLLCAGAVILAIFGSSEIFSPVLFAWTAMGAAFGPLLLVILFRGRVAPPFALAAMIVGFSTAVVAYSLPWAQGTWWERVVPFLLAYGCAHWGSRRNRERVTS